MPSSSSSTAATDNIVLHISQRAQADPTYRAVVLAHPGSGTTWLVDLFNFLGYPALHELVRPADRPDWRVLVTFRQLGWTIPATERLHLIRDPRKVVPSVAALFAQRPRVARDIVAQILGSGHTVANPAVGAAGPLTLAAWCLTHFEARARAAALPTFRIEDVSAPACAPPTVRRNPHARDARGLRFEDLEIFHAEVADLATRGQYA